MALLDTKVDSNYFNYSTGLLVSILLRYPEVGTISCIQEQEALVLRFLVSNGYDFDLVENKLIQALELFHKIEGRKMSLCEIEKNEQEVGLLIIKRDFASMTQNEMNLIVGIIKSELGKQLIRDDAELSEDEAVFEEDAINHLLAALRSNGTEKSMTAVREDGRVLIFNG